MKGTAFDLFHPVVPLCYFVLLFVICMTAMHPVYVAISLVGAAVYSFILRGARAAMRSAFWQAPLVLVLAVANPLFSASGSTELFRIGVRAFYLESFAYGLCMGVMLVAVLLTFSNAAHVISSDKIMSLTGGSVPVVGLMISMVARLVPQFVRRGSDIEAAQHVCTAARFADTKDQAVGEGRESMWRSGQREGPSASKSRLGAWGRMRVRASSGLRVVSVLMGWSMEDSLDTSAAMRSRGWGSGVRRTTYVRHRFKSKDMVALGLILLLGLGVAIAAVVACSAFRFYPKLTGFVPWWNYFPYALFVLLPFVLEAGERVRWRM